MLQAAIWQCLNQHKLDDAIFLSERLHAELRSDESLFLLGTSYYRAGRLKATKILLNGKFTDIFNYHQFASHLCVISHRRSILRSSDYTHRAHHTCQNNKLKCF